jgi:cytochrome c2
MLNRFSAIATIFALSVSFSAQAADAQAGRVASQKCVQCHEADDWEGEDAASLQSLINDIIAGKVKHKTRIELTAAEAADIAAFWGSGGK